jgi:hypothetical protein
MLSSFARGSKGVLDTKHQDASGRSSERLIGFSEMFLRIGMLPPQRREGF